MLDLQLDPLLDSLLDPLFNPLLDQLLDSLIGLPVKSIDGFAAIFIDFQNLSIHRPKRGGRTCRGKSVDIEACELEVTYWCVNLMG